MTNAGGPQKARPAMTLVEAIEGRRSVRRFKEDPVPEADIIRIIRAATLAPSAGNEQMWHFLVTRDKKKMEALLRAVEEASEEALAWPEVRGNEEFEGHIKGMARNAVIFTRPPVVIAALTKPYGNPLDSKILPAHGLRFQEIHRLRADPGTQSLGAAVQNLLLMALALGYGTCWMTGPLLATFKMERILGIKEPWRLACLIPLGVPDYAPDPRPRRPLEENYTLLD